MAVDNDTLSSQITYSLLNTDLGVEYFQIDRNTGRIVVSIDGHNNLDYETVQQFNLTVCDY